MKNSIIAFIPSDIRVIINSKLEVAGFGPNNFSIPLYNSKGIISMWGMHAYDNGSMYIILSSIPTVHLFTVTDIKPIVAFDIEATKLKVKRLV